MSVWSCLIAWLRFTVPNSSVDAVMSLIGGEWIREEKGFQGYLHAWVSRGNHGGLGRIGTGATRAPKEVHVDLSQEWISGWSYEQFQKVTAWVLAHEGHVGRIDVAMDDRTGVIEVEQIYDAVVAGHCVSHFRQSRLIAGLDVGSGLDTGKTLCMGSRQSDTFLRVYDKAAEQKSKGVEVDGPWIRWEMEWKNERAQAVGLALANLDQEHFQRYLVGVFRTALDFRTCTREDDPKDRYFAPLLDWWKVLTDGMQRAKLQIAKVEKQIEDVKRWAEQSLSPMLGLLCAHPEAGERWLIHTIVEGVERWRSRHYALLGDWQAAKLKQRMIRYWRPSEGFRAGLANAGS